MSNSKKRVITAIILGLVLIPFIFFGGYFFFGLLAILAFLGTYEVVKMHNEKRNIPVIFNYVVPSFSLVFVLLMMLVKLTNYLSLMKILIFGLVICFIFILVVSLLYKELKITDGFFYIGSIFYAGLSFGLMGIIRSSNIITEHELMIGSYNINVSGLSIFILVLLTNMLTDVFAYEVGKRIGKRKLIPDVSPNKTIEGSIFGSLIGSLVGCFVFVLLEYFLGFNLIKISNYFLHILIIYLICLFLSIVSQLGDLVASKLKREYEIKDYGTIFPGHGGVMDRFDSLILSSAIFFIILGLLGVVL